jgi:membrane protein
MIQRFTNKLVAALSRFYGEFKALRIISYLIGIKDLIVATFVNWVDDDIPLHGAALAFYTIFSLAPLVIIVIATVAFFFGEQAAAGQLEAFLNQLIGQEAASFIQNMIKSASTSTSSFLATAFGVGTIAFTSTTVITQLKSSLNIIWNVETREGQSIRQFVISRFTALLLVFIVALILISSLIVDTVLAVIREQVEGLFPDLILLVSWGNYVVFVLATILLFTTVFKMLPDIRIRWIDALVGAFVTTILFMIGRFFIGMYIGQASLSTTYGAAGTFVVLLIWIYYNSMTIFLGAEFTHQYTIRYGGGVQLPKHARFKRRIKPKEKAPRVT